MLQGYNVPAGYVLFVFKIVRNRNSIHNEWFIFFPPFFLLLQFFLYNFLFLNKMECLGIIFFRNSLYVIPFYLKILFQKYNREKKQNYFI